MSAKTGTSGLRADAQRNREQILNAAGALFAERGPDVPMEEVARRAGVGVGTLYRRFPDRDALVRAVAFESFHRVVAQAQAATGEADGWSGLTSFIQGAAADLRLAAWLSIWFARTWAEIKLEPEQRRSREELLAILERLVRRAQQEGAMRTDVGAGDLALLLALVLRPLPGPLGPITDRAAERYARLMLEGLRAQPAGVRLPGEPISVADLDPKL